MSMGAPVKGTTAYGTTNVAPSYPAGITAGDCLIMYVAVKPATAKWATPTGWERVGEDSVGTTGSIAADTGPTRITTFVKKATGSESGAVTVSIGSGTGDSTLGDIYRSTPSTGVFSARMISGQDTSSGTGYSAACNSGAGWAKAGDLLLGLASKPTDAGTVSAEGFSATGLTIGASTEIAEYTTPNGNDSGGWAWYATVTSGTQTATAITATATLSSASYGPAAILRIRDALDTTPRPVDSASGGTTGAGTATIALPDGKWFMAVLHNVSAVPSGWVVDPTFGDQGYRLLAFAKASDSPGTGWVANDSEGCNVVITGYDQVPNVSLTYSAGPTLVSPTATAPGPASVARIVCTEGATSATIVIPTAALLDPITRVNNSSASYAMLDGISHSIATASGSVGTATWTGTASNGITGTVILTAKVKNFPYGALAVDDAKMGSSQVDKVYQGTDLVWEA